MTSPSFRVTLGSTVSSDPLHAASVLWHTGGAVSLFRPTRWAASCTASRAGSPGYQNPLQSLFAAACIYFLLLFTLSKLSRRLELPDRAVSPPPDVHESALARLRPARAG